MLNSFSSPRPHPWVKEFSYTETCLHPLKTNNREHLPGIKAETCSTFMQEKTWRIRSSRYSVVIILLKKKLKIKWCPLEEAFFSLSPPYAFLLPSINMNEIYLSFFNLCGVRFSVQKGDMVKEGEKLNTLLSTSPEQKPAAGRGSALLARRPGTQSSPRCDCPGAGLEHTKTRVQPSAGHRTTNCNSVLSAAKLEFYTVKCQVRL